MLAYYDEVGHKDFEHKLTGAPVLKAQHPEFELWSQGIHARSGVACADCHMPYTRVGALKISDHHVRSPLLNIARACQTCHKASEDELKARVETIQGRTFELRNLALDALLALIDDLQQAAHRRRRAGRHPGGPAAAAPGPVPGRLHRGGELDGFPRRPGGGPHPGGRAWTPPARGSWPCARWLTHQPRGVEIYFKIAR